MINWFFRMIRSCSLQVAGKREAVCESGAETLHGAWVRHCLPWSEQMPLAQHRREREIGAPHDICHIKPAVRSGLHRVQIDLNCKTAGSERGTKKRRASQQMHRHTLTIPQVGGGRGEEARVRNGASADTASSSRCLQQYPSHLHTARLTVAAVQPALCACRSTHTLSCD